MSDFLSTITSTAAGRARLRELYEPTAAKCTRTTCGKDYVAQPGEFNPDRWCPACRREAEDFGGWDDARVRGPRVTHLRERHVAELEKRAGELLSRTEPQQGVKT